MEINNDTLFVLPVFTLLHSERPKLYGVLAVLSAIGLRCISALSRSIALPYAVLLPFQWGSTVTGRNLLPMEKILYFRSRPLSSWAANKGKLFPFVHMAVKHEALPIHHICLGPAYFCILQYYIKHLSKYIYIY